MQLELAQQLLNELYDTPEDKRVFLAAEFLLKSYKLGYIDALDNGWWKEQELYNGVCYLGQPKETK